MRLATALLVLAGCARAQVGAEVVYGASSLGEASPGLGAEVGGWLRGEKLGFFFVAEAGGITLPGDADPQKWIGLDARGRVVVHDTGRVRIPFVFGGGAGFEVGYLNNAQVSALAEIGVEGDVGPIVLGLRARERFGFYLGAESDSLLSWVSTTSAVIDVGYRF